MSKKILLLGLALALAWGIFAAPAPATPTNNNITYNADITDSGALILYGYAEWGNNKFDDGHWAGLSYGLFDTFEIGGSWRLTESEDFRQDPVLDAKFRFDLFGDGDGDETDENGWMDTSGIAIGADNINFDDDKNGNIIPYLVYTHDFEGMRAHLGYSFEEDNGAAFIGFDATTGDATLLWDWTQVDDGDSWRGAVGFEMPFEWFDDNWAVSSWLSFASNSTKSDTWYLEFNYTVP